MPFSVQKGHIKCTIALNQAHLLPFVVTIFNHATCVDSERSERREMNLTSEL